MKRILILLIDFYRKYISVRKGPTCRFTPTCSQYAKEAIQYHGSLKGSWMAIKRILRCHPFYKGPSYDPVKPVEEDKLATDNK